MLTRCAHAKVNWTLDITGTRPDGYHLMDMVMQSLTLADTLTFQLREDGVLHLSVPGSTLAPDETNLVLRAARALKDYTGCTLGADITLTKHIPMGAGLGGGSADCACTLKGLRDLWGVGLTDEALSAIGLQLGADVPYCLFGRSARVQGIGEIITPIAMQRPFPMVLIQPCQALSTREAFRSYDENPSAVRHPDHAAALPAFAAGNIPMIAKSCANVMQPSSERLRPDMVTALTALRERGAFLAQMTGSGSVVFGAFDTDQAADAAFDDLCKVFHTCIRTATMV